MIAATAIRVAIAAPALIHIRQLTVTPPRLVVRGMVAGAGMALPLAAYAWAVLSMEIPWLRPHLGFGFSDCHGASRDALGLQLEPPENVLRAWRTLADAAGVGDVHFFVWPARQGKVANAFANGPDSGLL